MEQTRALTPLQQFNGFMTNVRTQEYLAQVLGDKKAQFVSNLTALVAGDQKLQACVPATIMYAALTATALDLPLNKTLGMAYVIPYRNGRAGISEAQFQIGWKGLVELAQRSGRIKKLNATDVREGELAGHNLLTGDITLTAVPNRESKPIVGYAAYVQLDNGFSKTLYMTREEIELHAKRYSQTYGSQREDVRKSSKWTTDFDAMALKTVIKQLINKWVPKSIEMQTAILADQSVQRAEGEYTYVDNERGSNADRLADIDARIAQEVAVDADVDEVTGEATQSEPAKSLFDDESAE